MKLILVCYCHTQSNAGDLHRVWSSWNQHSHLPVSRVRDRSVLLGYARPVLPIQHGTPSILGKKCQGEYIYMVYVLYITCICWSYSWYIHVLTWLCSLHDCLASIPPYPFYIRERDNDYDVAESLFDLDRMWFVRPQPFVHCTLLLMGTAAGRYIAATTVPTRTSRSTWFSWNFAWRLLESWNRKEFTGCTSPHLFPRSMSEGLRTSSAESLSFHAFWTEMQPQLFHISTAADSWTLLSAVVPIVRALPRGGAAMFTRSTPGCGILDGPSLAWAASQWPRLRRSEGSPGLMLPSERGPQSGPGLSSEWNMHGIYLVYTMYIPRISQLWVKSIFCVHLSCCPVLPCCVRVFPILPTFIASLLVCQNSRLLKMGYALHIQGIYIVYVRHIQWNHVALLSRIIMLCWQVLSSTFDCPQPWHGFTTLKLQEIHQNRFFIYLAYT